MRPWTARRSRGVYPWFIVMLGIMETPRYIYRSMAGGKDRPDDRTKAQRFGHFSRDAFEKMTFRLSLHCEYPDGLGLLEYN